MNNLPKDLVNIINEYKIPENLKECVANFKATYPWYDEMKNYTYNERFQPMRTDLKQVEYLIEHISEKKSYLELFDYFLSYAVYYLDHDPMLPFLEDHKRESRIRSVTQDRQQIQELQWEYSNFRSDQSVEMFRRFRGRLPTLRYVCTYQLIQREDRLYRDYIRKLEKVFADLIPAKK